MSKQLLPAFIMALSLIPSIVKAQSFFFSAENEDGVTIHYHADESTMTCYVTFLNMGVVSSSGYTYYEYYSDYVGDVVIPSSVNGFTVTSIGHHAFNKCTSLTSVTIPNSVTSISKSAFWGCTSLTSVSIPISVTSISESAFQNCTSLTSFTIPNSVTSISDYTFSGCTNLASVTIPNLVTSISNGAFSGCNEQLKIIFEDIDEWNNISIGNAFDQFYLYSDENTEITDVIIPSSITSLSNNYAKCKSLTSVTIPNSVTNIETGAFEGCSNLISVTIPNSITSIGYNTFSGCTNLTSVNIPNSITSIGDGAFYDCTNLASFNIPNSLTHIGAYAFENTAWYNNNPDGIVYAGKFAYSYKGELPADKNIVIENGTLYIADYSFVNLDMTSVTIPSSVTSIGFGAFSYCANLETVYCHITDFFDIDMSVFEGSENTTLYVPKDMAITYRASTGWSVIKYIDEMPDETSDASFLLSCNTKGSVSINGGTAISSKITSSEFNEDAENTFTFTPKSNCKLDQVILNGLDITVNVENNTLTTTIPANSQMIVTFTNQTGDINNDGVLDITDVVAIVNKILGY